MGFDPARDFQFRIIYVTAEVLSPAMRREIEQRWNARVYDNYGSVEAAASVYECHCRNGWHICEDAYIFEVVDPETGEPLPPGEEGVLIITSLFREASPFFRYRVGDVVSLWAEPCDCGRTFRRMSPVRGRADEMLKLRGISVYPTAIEQVLRTFPALGLEWYLMLSSPGSVQEITVQVEAASPLGAEERGALALRVADQLKQEIGVRLDVEIFDPGQLVPEGRLGAQVKTRRVRYRSPEPATAPQDSK
jgi:phenylacetate-CoA ligase